MRPERPGSAKSAVTKITLDSEQISKDLNNSKFSQTFSSGVRNNRDDFAKYVEHKNKDPKFKKYLQPNLPEIPQKIKQSTELSKLTSKPFQRKTSKIDKEKVTKKVEQPPPKKQQPNQTKKSFVDKSKQKLNSMRNSSKIENKQPEDKPKISFNGFVVNVPGKGKKVIQEEQKQQKRQEQDEQMKRRRNITQLQDFINDIQARNSEFYPKEYDEFIEKSRCSQIDKINIDEFVSEPNERDYQKVFNSIVQNDKMIQSQDKQETSVNLDEIIDGKSNLDDSVMLSFMSASDIRERNMFVTEIMKGKLTQEKIKDLEDNDKVQMKLIKLQQIDKKQKKEEEEDVEFIELQMPKKKTNKILQRNKIQASGQLYQQCDYLTQQQQQRIDQLINGTDLQMPFTLSQMDQFKNRRIDEGIQVYRSFSEKVQEESQVIPESNLPKDPILKKQAEIKFLKQKIKSVNGRLMAVNEVVINKTKIRNLIEKCKETTAVSQIGKSLILQKQKQLNQQNKKLEEVEEFLLKAQSQKDQILQMVQEMQQTYENLQSDLIKLTNMNAQERYQYELKQLQEKKERIKDIEQETQKLVEEMESFTSLSEELQNHIQILDSISNLNSQNMNCANYDENETIEDLDTLITKKWEKGQQLMKGISLE